MKQVAWVVFSMAVSLLFSMSVVAELRVHSSGITVDSGASQSYLNFDATNGSGGFGIRDNNGSLEYKVGASGSWSEFDALEVWKKSTIGSLEYIYPAAEETDSEPNAWVCIGNETPETLLHIYDNDDDNSGNEDHRPQFNIYQDGAGDASQTFRLQLMGGHRHHFTLGIDQYFKAGSQSLNDSADFKISHESYKETGGSVPSTLGFLKGEAYNTPEMMVRIHGTDWFEAEPDKDSVGIIDFNHQSRARYYATSVKATTIKENIAAAGTWTPVYFNGAIDNSLSWDEHLEVKSASDATNKWSRFVAKEEGYYQVNARVEFNLMAEPIVPGPGALGNSDNIVSISIWRYSQGGFTMHSQGNNLQIVNGNLFNWYVALNPGLTGPDNPGFLFMNNAPNISDTVYLKKGEGIEIRVLQDTLIDIPLNVAPATGPPAVANYVSIHKVS